MLLRIISGIILWCFLLSAQAYGEDSQTCLSCHGDREMMKTMAGTGARSLHVDQAALMGSVHGSLDCTACHQDISMETHPKKGKTSRRSLSGACMNCHTVFRGVHSNLTAGRSGNMVCADCHTAHAVKKVKSIAFTRDSDYCLNCHAKEINKTLGDGTKLSLRVDRNHLAGSVHRLMACSDCHFGFSSGAHPGRQYKNERDYRVASAEKCRRCHFREYSDTLESVHSAVSQTKRKGNGPAAVCSDCHGAHGITPALELRAMDNSPCAKCHADTHEVFVDSIHGTARIRDKNQDAPTCLSCHGAHAISDTKSASFHLRIPEMCGKCHADEKRIGKYGISSTVVKTYKQDFHGITLGFYKKKGGAKHPAVCTDCHGTHDIADMYQPNSPQNKAYLEQKCRRCHPDAPEGFADSLLPHYQASFTGAPTVFTINLFYKMFIGLMVVGLFVQILLHIRRILRHNEEKNNGN